MRTCFSATLILCAVAVGCGSAQDATANTALLDASNPDIEAGASTGAPPPFADGAVPDTSDDRAAAAADGASPPDATTSGDALLPGDAEPADADAAATNDAAHGDAAGPCVPLSCAAQGLSCGAATNGCGVAMDCGSCGPGTTCGLTPPNVCATSTEPLACRAGWCFARNGLFGGALAGVWGFAANDVWIVGDHGTVWHWNGSALEDQSPPGVNAFLRDVWGTSATDLWVVTDSAMLHRTATGWQSEPVATNTLWRVWGAGANVWAADQGSVFLRAAAGWTSIGGAMSYVSDGWASGPTDVWAIGSGIEHYDGMTWSAVSVGGTGTARAVWGTGPSDVYVTQAGGLYHYDGMQWTQTASTASPDLENVWRTASGTFWSATSFGMLEQSGAGWLPIAIPSGMSLKDLWGVGNELWAVGLRGTVLHYDGAQWNRVHADGFSQDVIEAVDGTSSTDVWAMLSNWQIGRYDGSAWRSLPFTQGCVVQHIFVPSPGKPWAAGYVGPTSTQPCLLEWDGTNWQSQTLTGATGLRIAAIGGSGPSDVWLAGQYGGPSLHWNGGSWQSYTVSSVPLAVTSASPTLGYMACAGDVQRFAGGQWTSIRGNLLPALSTTFVNDVWLAPSGVPWVVGDQGIVASYGGGTWNIDPPPTTSSLAAISGAGAKVWAVAKGAGAVLFERGATWQVAPAPPRGSLNDVWAASEQDAWAVGLATLLHWDGRRFWDPDGALPTEIRGAYFLSPTNGWAVSESVSAGYVLRWDGGQWTEDFATGLLPAAVWAADATHVYVGTDEGDTGSLLFRDASGWHTLWRDLFAGVSRIWGTSPDDVWVLEKRSTAAAGLNHWDGQHWSKDVSAPPYSLAASASAIWGSSPKDVWLGTDKGVYHFDGMALSPKTVPTAGHVVGLWGASAAAIWAITDQACEVLTYGGASWQSTTLPACSGVKLQAVWGTGPSDVWVGGGINGRSAKLAHWDGGGWPWVFVPLDGSIATIAGAGSAVWVAADYGDLLRKAP
jgi:hypothetical protein